MTIHTDDPRDVEIGDEWDLRLVPNTPTDDEHRESLEALAPYGYRNESLFGQAS